jgi:hypothetical protein
MKVTLLVDDWRKNGKSVYSTNEAVFARAAGSQGERFPASIYFSKDTEKAFLELIKEGYQPVFQLAVQEYKAPPEGEEYSEEKLVKLAKEAGFKVADPSLIADNVEPDEPTELKIGR